MPSLSPHRERSLILIILLITFLVRWYYATHIEFENDDEVANFTLAQRISFHPDHFFVPVGSEKLLHPPLNLYLIKLGFLIGGITPLAARLPFIFLGTFSLLFLYFLAREGVGKKGAFLTLLLAGFDQYLIQMSILMTERVYLAFIPPALYFFYRGIKTGEKNYFLWLGIVLGLGYLGRESILLLLPGFGLYLLLNAPVRKFFFRPHIYLTSVITMVIISPNLIWNATHGDPSFEHYVMKFQAIGFSPRAIALYLGELIIASLSKAYVFINSGHRIWPETEVTAHWVTGSLYLLATIWALRQWKNDFFRLLLLMFSTVVVLVSLICPNEDLNNFWWASLSYIPALIMAAHFLRQISSHGKTGFLLVAVFCVYVIIRGLVFMTLPDHCSRYLSKEMEDLCSITQANRQENYTHAEKLSLEFIKKNPMNDMGHLFLGETYFYQKKYNEAEKEYEQTYTLNPKNMMMPYFRARIFVAKNQLDKAVMEMYKALNLDLKNYTFHYHLAIIYNAMGNGDGAIEEMEKAIRLKSDQWGNYGFLAVLYFHKGKYAEARKWIDRFRKFYPYHPEAVDMVKRLEGMGY